MDLVREKYQGLNISKVIYYGNLVNDEIIPLIKITKGINRKIAIFLFFFLVFTSFSCKRTIENPENSNKTGNTYYVSLNGNDENSGSQESPWRTPGFGSRQLTHGDTLIILAGRYILKEYDGDILTPPSGTPDDWVTIKGEENNRPILAGRDNLSAALRLSSYLKVKNLEITSDNGALFRDGLWQIEQPISHLELNNLYIHHIDEFGINIADVNELTISNCNINYTGFGSVGGPEAQSGGWQNVVIDGCQFSFNGHYYQGGLGPSPYARPDGFGIEPSSGPIEINNSIAQHNRGDGFDSKASNTYIHHCIVANNSCDGIKLWAGDSRIENCLIYGTGDGLGGASPWAGLVIEGVNNGDTFNITNVTIHDNPSRQAYPMYVGYDQTADIEVIMRNCIVVNGYGVAYFGPRVNAFIEYNLFFRPGSSIQVQTRGRDYSTTDILNGLLGVGNIVADPLFINPAWGWNGDYHLEATSPAIDAGTAINAPTTDLENNSRPKGNGYDMGAYENQ